MVIFTDPESDDQVMAFYSHNTNSAVWEYLGYDRHELDFNQDVSNYGRDCYVVFDSSGVIVDVVARVNPIQPR